MRFVGTPSTSEKLPPATSSGPPPRSSTSSVRSAPSSIPPPTGDQETPSQRATRFALTPPATVNEPPAYSAGPPPFPSSKTASALTVRSVPLPTRDQLEPSQRAMLLAATPPAVEKVPPA